MADFTVADLRKHTMTTKEADEHVSAIIKSINQKILKHPIKYGINVVEFTLPEFGNQEKLYIHGCIVKNLVHRGFSVAFTPADRESLLYIKWAQEFDQAKLQDAVHALKSVLVKKEDIRGLEKFLNASN